tara:strand:+ start:32594 stop:33616 length:1023 start_codon:yes stop_codon:yes gene_type:complete
LPIITRTADSVESEDWRQVLSESFRRPADLLNWLGLPAAGLPGGSDDQPDFPMLVPRPYARRMEARPDDPLLLQVLPLTEEKREQPGFITDPLAEDSANTTPGIIHKYHGRVLLLAASGCAVNCRYCFRRHFPYADNRLSRAQWQQALDYVRRDNSISEIILSGGDPLMLQDADLQQLIDHCQAIPHVRRLRIHTRLPVVIPQRLTPALTAMLAATRLQVSMVLHINHPRELSDDHRRPLKSLAAAGITLLNQSVLLAQINNNISVLSELSERLFEFGILPYYLHLLDRVKGAHHFDVPESEAIALHQELQTLLPGYLVPKLAREVAGLPNKAMIHLDRD